MGKILRASLFKRLMTSAGMDPGPEHFGEVERVMIDTMTTEMTVSALVRLWLVHSFARRSYTPEQAVHYT